MDRITTLTNVCTLVTINLIKDFLILEKSLSLTNPNLEIVVLCDKKAGEVIKNLRSPRIIVLDNLEEADYQNIKQGGDKWLDLMLNKATVIRYALNKYKSTLFVDSDLIFLSKIDFDFVHPICLSEHLIYEKDIARTGRFNGGCIYVSDDRFPQWLVDTTKSRSKYYEQQTLDYVAEEFEHDVFPIQYNFGWWRLIQCEDSEERREKFTAVKGIEYDGEPLVSIHTHILDATNIDYQDFNRLIIRLLKKSKDKKHRILLNYIVQLAESSSLDLPKFIVPSKNSNHYIDDTFRELLTMWSDEGLCYLEYSDKASLVWYEKTGSVLLYDRPTLEWLKNVSYEYILLGNPSFNAPNASSWIFWARRPSLLEKVKNDRKDYTHRDIESVFLGGIESFIQEKNRVSDEWAEYIELFEMANNRKYKYSQEEYLQLLGNSKFGLCLPGYGNKCNREIELMGMGTIPIITPGVDLEYYNHLEEGKHYVFVNNGSELRSKLDTIGFEKWTYMSNACVQWYEENASTVGSFKTTMAVIEDLQATNVQSFSKKISYIRFMAISLFQQFFRKNLIIKFRRLIFHVERIFF